MIRIDMKNFEESPSVYIAKVRAGETIIITDVGVPFAEAVPVFPPRTPQERRLGSLKDKITIHPSFYDPMNEDELKLREEGDPRSPI